MTDGSLINNPWFVLGSSLLSGVIAVIISTCCYRNFEKRKVKLDCFRRLLGARYALTNGQHSAGVTEAFFIALNEAVVIYSDTPSVISALKTLQAELQRNERFEDNVVTLFRAMADNLNIDRETLNDSFFLKPFKPMP